MPPSSKSTHQALAQPPDLFALMRLCGVSSFTGSLGALHQCPRCEGRPKEPVKERRRRIESLRVYQNIHNEILVRCHCCGLDGTALDLYRAHSGLPWEMIVAELKKARVFGDEDIPTDWIGRAKRWEKFAHLFEKAKGFFRQWVRNGQMQELGFGEVGLCSAIQLERTLPGVKLMSRWGKSALFLVELRRSLHGHPTHVLIRHRKKGHAVAVFDFHPPEPLHLMVPEWALYRDWSEEMTVFTDLGLAGQLHEMVSKAPSGTAPPLAWIADCRRPLVDEVPCRTIRYIPGPQGPEFALAFAQPGIEALVRSEDAMEQVATDIITRTKDTDPIAYLHTVLQKPWITPAVAKRLTEKVAARLGGQASTLITRSGATDRILPCTIRGTTYLCRNEIYVKRRGKGDWEPVSNFSLRIEESRTSKNGQVIHHLLLLMEDGSTSFDITDQEFQDGRILRERAAASALQAGLARLPQIYDPIDLKRLPTIVQATQLKPPLRTVEQAARGFVDGRFYGPNFTSTSHGVEFRHAHATASTQWLRPEDPWDPQDDHLACRANELATWLGGLETRSCRMVAVVIHTALAWLHRSSRGLPSHLLLPSEAHLDLLGTLMGLVPIDVGRGPRKDLGLPRLMRSSYWRSDQFGRHGHVVAALEDHYRKIAHELPLVTHEWAHEAPPNPPAGILSLLTHACLGTRDPMQAADKLASLVECPDLRAGFRSLLEVGSFYSAAPGRYLDTFLSALRLLPDLEDHVIQRKDKALLKRTVVERLNKEHDFNFRETRLIDELRNRFPLPQPARYGKEQLPVFRLPPEALVTG